MTLLNAAYLPINTEAWKQRSIEGEADSCIAWLK